MARLRFICLLLGILVGARAFVVPHGQLLLGPALGPYGGAATRGAGQQPPEIAPWQVSRNDRTRDSRPSLLRMAQPSCLLPLKPPLHNYIPHVRCFTLVEGPADDERPLRPPPAPVPQQRHDHHDERTAHCGCRWGAPPRAHHWRRDGRRGGGRAAAGQGRDRRLHRGARGDALLPGVWVGR